MSEERSIWVWVINRPDTRQDVFGAMRRCDRAHWTAVSARAEVMVHVWELELGRVKWDEVDDRTWVGRSALGYMIVVASVLLPHPYSEEHVSTA
jgi:hypothetical protein